MIPIDKLLYEIEVNDWMESLIIKEIDYLHIRKLTGCLTK